MFCVFLWISEIHSAAFYQDGAIVLENGRVRKTIQVSDNKPSAIKVVGYLDCLNKQEWIHTESSLPWFEFVVNHRKVTAMDADWSFESINEKVLKNGGRQYELTFKAIQGHAKGLVVVVHQILYPESTLIREKIELRGDPQQQFTLNKYRDQLWFKFPQYAVVAGRECNSEEIRIATWGKEVIERDPSATYDDRKFDGGAYFNLAQCHMFHPQAFKYSWNSAEHSPVNKRMMKGPFAIIEQKGFKWLTTYEHASQDSREGMDEGPVVDNGSAAGVVDALQGVQGSFLIDKQDQDRWFLGIGHQKSESALNVSVEILRGGYLDGEAISSQRPYTSVWTATAFAGELDSVEAVIRDYLLHQITEYPASRQPAFYYNTWGMQRDLGSRGEDIWAVFTQERVLAEIERAAKLKVDLFVLDDGWNQMMGVWKPHHKRLPEGLAPIRQAIEARGMKMGIWLSPLGIARSADRYKDNPHWVIKDDQGEPVRAQWGHPAFDFVSDFKDTLVADCKWLIDQGARFFKWDAINSLNSSLPGLHHGSRQYSREELRARYDYLLPIYVTDAMLQLMAYNEEVVIEIDLTEAGRAMPGLIVLQAGKFFWMNNGASGYGDYSTYRAKSMRTIPNRFNGILPLDLFTYANYPHNPWPFFAQRYNVNSSLISGYGFWGNLELLTDEQLERAGRLVGKSKRVLPFLTETTTEVSGPVGAAPEVYARVNNKIGAGQVIAFSGQPLHDLHKIPLKGERVLGVLNHAYYIENDTLYLPFTFSMVDDTREAFMMPNHGSGISILSSTTWIDDVQYVDKQLTIKPGAEGKIVLVWDERNGQPNVSGVDKRYTINRKGKKYFIEMEVGPEEVIMVEQKGK